MGPVFSRRKRGLFEKLGKKVKECKLISRKIDDKINRAVNLDVLAIKKAKPHLYEDDQNRYREVMKELVIEFQESKVKIDAAVNDFLANLEAIWGELEALEKGFGDPTVKRNDHSLRAGMMEQIEEYVSIRKKMLKIIDERT